MKSLLIVLPILLLGACASQLDKTGLRTLDAKGQPMADDYVLVVKASTLVDSLKDSKIEKAKAFKSTLRQEAINAGNTDLAPIEE